MLLPFSYDDRWRRLSVSDMLTPTGTSPEHSVAHLHSHAATLVWQQLKLKYIQTEQIINTKNTLSEGSAEEGWQVRQKCFPAGLFPIWWISIHAPVFRYWNRSRLFANALIHLSEMYSGRATLFDFCDGIRWWSNLERRLWYPCAKILPPRMLPPKLPVSCRFEIRRGRWQTWKRSSMALFCSGNSIPVPQWCRWEGHQSMCGRQNECQCHIPLKVEWLTPIRGANEKEAS